MKENYQLSPIDKPMIHTGITHSGKFHCDDVCCAALLKLIYPDIEIIRVPNFTGNPDEKDDTIVFDIGEGKYDHHGVTQETRPDGVIYSSFGKLYRDFAKYLMPANIAKYIDYGFVREIDKMDNGQGYSSFGAFLASYNVLWNENTNEEDAQFFKAVNMAQEFIINLMEKRKSEEQANDIIEEACKVQNSPIIIFDKPIPLHNSIKESVLFAITPSSRNGYNLQALKNQDGKIRRRLPSEWNTNPPKGMVFNHTSGSLANFDTLYNAIDAANSALENKSKFPSNIVSSVKRNKFKVRHHDNKLIEIDGIDILSNNKVCVYYEKVPFYTLNSIELLNDGTAYINTEVSYGIVDNRNNSDYITSAREFNENSDTIKIVERVLSNGNTYDI